MITIDPKTNERIFELKCSCGTNGGEVRFPEKHGRVNDEALNRECLSVYSHKCEKCAKK